MAQGLGRVLVVDDDEVIRQLIAVNLTLEGFDVATALVMDGQEGRAEARLGWPVVVLPAEIDTVNAAGIGAELRSAFAAGATTVVADLTRTTFCDSSGVQMLTLAHKQATAHSIELRLAVPSRAVLRLFALTGLDRLLPIYPSVGSALTEGRALDGQARAGSP